MEVEMHARIAFHHLADVTQQIQWIQDAQRIGQHKTSDRQVFQRIDQLEDVIGRVFDPVRPVFQIYINLNTSFGSQRYNRTDICNMLFGQFAELFGYVFIRTFTEKVYHAATGRFDPVERGVAIHKAQYFELMQISGTFGPGSHSLHGFELSVRYASRGNLHAVYSQIPQQHLCNTELFVSRKRDTRCLFPVPKGCIHYFYHLTFYLLRTLLSSTY